MKLIDLQLIVMTRQLKRVSEHVSERSVLSELTPFPFMFFVHFAVSLSSLLR